MTKNILIKIISKLICSINRYFQERVILRENLPPDGVYFVLSGTCEYQINQKLNVYYSML